MKSLLASLAFIAVLTIANVSSALTISGNGYDISGSAKVTDGIEFIGINGYLGFDFVDANDHVLLTLTNVKNLTALYWMNFGDYTFGGFDHITNMYITENVGYRGTVLDFSYDDTSFTLDMDLAEFRWSCRTAQTLTFYIETQTQQEGSPVPEPASFILFGIGLLGLSWVSNRRRS